MYKIINPCKCKVYTRTGNEVDRNAFVRIEYKDSKLSMSGVVAPLSNGDCLGSAGQCVDEIRNANDNTVSYVNQNGYILDGNEYFTAFDGETGKTIDTIYYPIPRLDYESWGDTNGNRCDRYVASVAWLDGQRPYAVYWRGYYMGRNGRQRPTG